MAESRRTIRQAPAEAPAPCRMPPEQPAAAAWHPGPPAGSPIRKPPHDPNNIIGPAGFGDQNFVAAQPGLPYTIDFENEPTAGLPAQQVRSPSSSIRASTGATFRLGSFGFGGRRSRCRPTRPFTRPPST